MDQYFATNFEDFRHERSFNLLLLLLDPDILKQSKVADHEKNLIQKILLLRKYIDREY